MCPRKSVAADENSWVDETAYNRSVSRLRRVADRDRVFFLTTNLGRGLAQFSSSERDLILDALADLRSSLAFRLFGYVVMPDHVHMLLTPQRLGLSEAMRDLKGKTGFNIAKRRHVSGPIWQARYFDNILRRARDFREKLEYIHRNPVEATLVSEPQDWKWSSFCFYGGLGSSPIIPDRLELPLAEDATLSPFSTR
jgi:putative transposase